MPKWFHRECAGLTPSDFQFLQENDEEQWFCAECKRQIEQRNNIDASMNSTLSLVSSSNQIETLTTPNYPPFEQKEVNENARSRMKWECLTGFNIIEEKY